MEAINDLTMNVIGDDDVTPARAPAASKPQEYPPNHWQADFNRVIAHDYQEFLSELIAKKRRLESVHVETCGETILLSVPPEASVPNLLAKLKALGDNLKLVMVRATKERTVFEGKLKAAKDRAFNSENILTARKAKYFSLLQGWRTQFEEKTEQLQGKCDVEKWRAVDLKQEKGMKDAELEKKREDHATEVRRLSNEVERLQGMSNAESKPCR